MFLEEEAQPSRQDGRNDRYSDHIASLMRRLRAEVGVHGITFAATTPGSEPWLWFDVGGVPPPSEYDYLESAGPQGHHVRLGRVDVDYFGVFNIQILAGRAFTAADADTSGTAVIVSQSFVRRFFGNGHAIGRRIRPSLNEDRWNGLAAALLVDRFVPSTIRHGPVVIPIVSAIMLTVGLFASIGPARRGLRIQPTEALKQE